MKRFVRALLIGMSVPVAATFLLGCPKKVEKAEPTPTPIVRESVIKTQPQTPARDGDKAGRDRTGTPEGGKTEDQRIAELLASSKEDIPIKEIPPPDFREPSSDEKLVLKNIYFDYDKSSIKPEYQKLLEGIAQWMSRNPTKQILVEGHCDERGTDEYNLALGERRALAVRRYLVGLGVLVDHLHTISYGEEKPADPGHDETSWVKNRRVEFMVSAQ